MSSISVAFRPNKSSQHEARIRYFDLSIDNEKENMTDSESKNKENIRFKPVNFTKAQAENPEISIDNADDLLAWGYAVLDQSPSARTMLAEAKKRGWTMSIETLEGPDFHIDVPEKQIILSDQGLPVSALGRSAYFKNALLVSMIRALRDVWQEKRHGAFDADYGPEEVLMLERVRAADLDILAVLSAWELRAEGQGGLWRHMIGSEDGDLAMRFSGYLERDPSSLFNGRALAAAFSQWFREERRIKACDHETLNYMDGLVEGGQGRETFGHKKLTAIAVERLSCLPDRTAYLQGQGREIFADPLYAGLNDPINQAHFMQIIYDLKVTRVQNVPFRSAALAKKIFPGGEFTPEIKG